MILFKKINFSKRMKETFHITIPSCKAISAKEILEEASSVFISIYWSLS